MNSALVQLQKIVAQGNWGYHPTGPQAAEPAAFACLALNAHELHQEAKTLADWLASLQQDSGSVGVTQDQDTPAWPTSLAMLAWQACDQGMRATKFDVAREKALAWTLQTFGKAAPQQDHIGHDTTLLGWSWAAATHSWLEPTCMFVLALKVSGRSKHPRTREGVRMIIDRQLETGGCNFGNTRVLGQATLPHVQPTGLALLAIADELSNDPRISRSLDYLEGVLTEETATASLCFGILGLTAHRRRPKNAETLLEHAQKRDAKQGTSNCYKLALLTLAGMQDNSWLPQSKSLPTARKLNMKQHNTSPISRDPTCEEMQQPSRRAVLALGGAAIACVAGTRAVRWATAPRAEVFVARNQKYDRGLEQTIQDGLVSCGYQPKQFSGKRVLLKPNLVEPCRAIPHMTTHPAMIIAASEVFRRWGATVQVGEAPGHVRDTEWHWSNRALAKRYALPISPLLTSTTNKSAGAAIVGVLALSKVSTSHKAYSKPTLLSRCPN